jgi:hypothetical protein
VQAVGARLAPGTLDTLLDATADEIERLAARDATLTT